MNKNRSMGVIANIVTGIIDAFIGGIVFNLLVAQEATGFNLYSPMVSAVGACILLWLAGKIKK